MAALDPQQDGDLTGSARPADVSGRRREPEIVRMQVDVPPDRIDLIECALDRFPARDCPWNPDGKEDGGDAALAQAGNVNRAVGVPGAEIEIGGEQKLRRVRVRVNDNRAKMEIPSLRRNTGRRSKSDGRQNSAQSATHNR
ncbi:MAG: hypothetical protein ABR973_05910 [Candidatus Acidiferrales bacterium]